MLRFRPTYFIGFFVILLICLAVGVLAHQEIRGWVQTGSGAADGGLPERYMKHGKLAIIIDDFGQSRAGFNEMLAINRPLTFAVLPFLEFSRADAELSYKKGFEVIIHLSMEPNHGKKSWLGPHPILSGMDPEEVRRIVEDSFENVPYASGANIHMGSKASSEESIMSSVLDVIKEKQLYFVDSRTSSKPVSRQLASVKGVPHLDRDVFLDGQQPKSFIKKRLREAGEIALKKGKAVAIGHVGIEGGKVTAQAIQEMLPEFDSKNIELVFVSGLLE